MRTSIREHKALAKPVSPRMFGGSRPNMLLGMSGSATAFARVQVVRTFAARLARLLGCKAFGEYDGLLHAPCGSIHTLGLRFAIDIVFLDAGLNVLAVAACVRPWRFARAPNRTRYVIELRAGRAGSCGLYEGRSVVLKGAQASHSMSVATQRRSAPLEVGTTLSP